MTGQTNKAQSLDRDDWMTQAACRDQPPRWFTDPDTPHEVRRAVDTCNRCPVKATCLTTALALPAEDDIGIWAGTTERERQLLRQGRTPPERPSPAPRPQSPPTRLPAGDPPAVRRLPAPEVTVARDAHGDFTDTTGRVLIFRIHGNPPWMVMIDQHCIARTPTLADARRTAWTHLHRPDVQQPHGCHNRLPSVRTSLHRPAAVSREPPMSEEPARYDNSNVEVRGGLELSRGQGR